MRGKLKLLYAKIKQRLVNGEILADIFASYSLLTQTEIDEINKALETEQFYNDTKTGYLAGTITDKQLAEFVVSGTITQTQADEIKQSKTQAYQ